MGFRQTNRARQNPLRICFLLFITANVNFAENAAYDLEGVSSNTMRDISTFKADQNRQLREEFKNSSSTFGGISQSLAPVNELKVPQLQMIGKEKTRVSNDKIASPDQSSVDQSQKDDLKFDAKKAVSQKVEEYYKLKTLVKESGKNYSQQSEKEQKKTVEQIKNLLELKGTLQEVPEKYFASDRPDFERHMKDVRATIDNRAKGRFDALTTTKDEDFLKRLQSSQDLQTEEGSKNFGDKNSDIQDNESYIGDRSVTDGDDLESAEDLDGIELVRSKCSGSVGSKNGAALVKHLTSGDCGEALNGNPELKAEYNIKKIVELISAWGFRTASFSSKTNIKLGINKLPDLGITLDLNNPKAGFKAIPYQPAVDVQQTQLLTTEEQSGDGPLTELMKPTKEKAVLRHSVRD